MATQTDIPSVLTNDEKAFTYQVLDAVLNSIILYALLYGIYTGILAVSLWNIFINKCWPIRQAVVVVIILLYTLIAVNFAVNWSYMCFAFVEDGQNFWAVSSDLDSTTQTIYWETGISASVSTSLADLYMIWCCWMIWGQCWLVVLLPIFSLVCAFVLKTMEVYYGYVNGQASLDIFLILYIVFNLVTTLYCTLLIIYRIVAVTGVRHGAVGRLRVYRHFIEVLVESSALYSLSVILDLAFSIHDDAGLYYLNTIAGIAKGVAPTLLVGRAAAGHTHPREDSDGSTVSSLHFQTPSELEESSIQSAVTMDIEAQAEQQVISIEQDTMMSMTSQASIVE
ncbi:hypothetical protein ARMGADRAFT_1162086 [Armillaria gallica]|uniref:Transmembrane protein n=1 Tax=Armillaria gallica TaxID=47427 RepID=A0A2H3EHQ6_ARMGA|nr:hypothetical protein ARMGADRAFT_1162086 [Armillaria gallica]